MLCVHVYVHLYMLTCVHLCVHILVRLQQEMEKAYCVRSEKQFLVLWWLGKGEVNTAPGSYEHMAASEAMDTWLSEGGLVTKSHVGRTKPYQSRTPTAGGQAEAILLSPLPPLPASWSLPLSPV